jgi:hypothetical protein
MCPMSLLDCSNPHSDRLFNKINILRRLQLTNKGNPRQPTVNQHQSRSVNRGRYERVVVHRHFALANRNHRIAGIAKPVD